MYLMKCNKCHHEWEKTTSDYQDCEWCSDGVGRPIAHLTGLMDAIKNAYRRLNNEDKTNS